MLKPFTHASEAVKKPLVTGRSSKRLFCLSTRKQIGNKAEARIKPWLNRTSPEGCLPSSLVMQFAFMLTNSHNNRQGALADGLHGLNPRITAHSTPLCKMRTALIRRLLISLVQRWNPSQCRKRTNPSCALGAFFVFKTLKVWRGKEEMTLSTLGELWSKGNGMDKGKAHAILNQVKIGFYFSQEKINEALYTTGDLYAQKIETTSYRSLCKNGNESCYVRTREDACEGAGERPNWVMEWNRLRSQKKD